LFDGGFSNKSRTDPLKPRESGAFENHFVAAGVLVFQEQVLKWKPGHRLNTYIRKAMHGSMDDAASQID
jgi:hypothetical protein